MCLIVPCLVLSTVLGVVEHALAATPASAVAPPTQSASDRLYVPETGHVIQGGFLDRWRAGHEAIFGLPLTEEFDDVCAGAPCTVQYFERARLEYLPSSGQIALGQLGYEALADRTFAREAPFASAPDRWYVQETGQALAFGFLRYWLANDGPRRLGQPISPELTEDGVTVQYFERGRLDYHADRPEATRVAVAPLGRSLVERRGWNLSSVVTFAVTSTMVDQGQPAALAVRGATAVTATLDNEAVAMLGGTPVWRGLAAFAPWAEPGERALVVRTTAPDGSLRLFQRSLRVAAYDFPHERFVVPAGQADLVTPGVRDRELAIVRPLYGIATPEQLWQGRWRWPVVGTITTEFATRRAYNDGPYNEYHGGVDIAAPTGAPVVAPAAGRVIYAGALAIRGNFVAVDHGLGLLSTYFHLSAIEVASGQMIEPGARIGRVGSTGLSSGPHLHWEARIAGTPVDPRAWLSTDLLP